MQSNNMGGLGSMGSVNTSQATTDNSLFSKTFSVVSTIKTTVVSAASAVGQKTGLTHDEPKGAMRNPHEFDMNQN